PATAGVRPGGFPEATKTYASSTSTTRLLALLGVRDSARKSPQVPAAIADAAAAGGLKVALGRPILVVESTDVDGVGIPVITTRARFPADRLTLTIDT